MTWLTFATELKTDFCKGQIIISYELSNLISIDLNGCERVYLKDVPNTISVRNRCYKLLGGVEFIPALCPDNIGHYRGHGVHNDQIVCYDDLMGKMYNSKEEPVILHALSYGLID